MAELVGLPVSKDSDNFDIYMMKFGGLSYTTIKYDVLIQVVTMETSLKNEKFAMLFFFFFAF